MEECSDVLDNGKHLNSYHSCSACHQCYGITVIMACTRSEPLAEISAHTSRTRATVSTDLLGKQKQLKQDHFRNLQTMKLKEPPNVLVMV